MRYSAFALARHALTRNPWQRAWRAAQPKPTYEIVIIGGGGHGLATAYYLAKNHGITNVAVLERSYIGSGNVGRNTTLVRSNYMMDGNTQFFEHSLKLWEGLSHELNFNVMLSQRGQVVLAHNPPQLDVLARKGNIMRLNGIDAELLERGDVMRLLPYLDYSDDCRASRSGAACCSGAPAPYGTTRWPGAMRARRARSASTSSRTARSPASCAREGALSGVETSRGRVWADAPPSVVAGPLFAGRRAWRAFGFRSRATCCRPSSASRSSRSSTT